jgi:hypothetical protein
MNVETGEIRRADRLTDEQRLSGKWAPLDKDLKLLNHKDKLRLSPSAEQRLAAAQAKREARAARRRNRRPETER